MKVIETDLPGCVVIEPAVFGDERGLFFETWNAHRYGQLGLPDKFIEHGDPAKLLAMCGLDAAGIEQSVLKRFGARPALVRPAVNH
jgi:deoxyxylulose-5-phosphate synthase